MHHCVCLCVSLCKLVCSIHLNVPVRAKCMCAHLPLFNTGCMCPFFCTILVLENLLSNFDRDTKGPSGNTTVQLIATLVLAVVRISKQVHKLTARANNTLQNYWINPNAAFGLIRTQAFTAGIILYALPVFPSPGSSNYIDHMDSHDRASAIKYMRGVSSGWCIYIFSGHSLTTLTTTITPPLNEPPKLSPVHHPPSQLPNCFQLTTTSLYPRGT